MTRQRLLWSIWAPLSLGIHAAVGLVIVGAVVCEPERVGSDDILVDLVQPRLAAPLASQALGDERRADRRAGRGTPTMPERAVRDPLGRAVQTAAAAPTPATTAKGSRQASGAPKAAASPRVSKADAQKPAPKERQLRRLQRLDPQAKPLAAALDGDTALASVTPVPRESQPTPKTRTKQPRRKDATSRLLAAMSRFEPATPVPVAVAKTIARSLRDKRARHRRVVARARAQRVRVSKLLAKMTATTRAASRGAALPGSGVGAGASRRLGLKFYLAGQPVLNSKVVRPPRPKRVPPTSCRVGRLGIPPTTVRMLVDQDGKVPVAYIKHASGHRAFDRCALRHAKRMRFYPGTDVSGAALDVWIQLRVEPSLHVASR